MYTVELIAKQSVMQDIKQSWINSGRDDNADHGVFIFENIEDAKIETGILQIRKGGNTFVYNVSDFYRIKVTNND